MVQPFCKETGKKTLVLFMFVAEVLFFMSLERGLVVKAFKRFSCKMKNYQKS